MASVVWSLTSILPRGWTRTERLPLLYIMKVIMFDRNSMGAQTSKLPTG